MRLEAAAIVSLVILAAPLPAQVVPAWKFQPGTSFTIERIYQQKQSVASKGKEFKSEFGSTWIEKFTVRKVADSEAVLERNLVSVTFKNANDKAKPSQPEKLEKLAERMKGSTFRLVVSPAGRIRSFEGYDEFIKKLSGNQADESSPHAPRDDFFQEKALRSLLPVTVLRDGLEEVLGFLPENAVKPGADWQREASEAVGPFGSLKTLFKYNYQGLGRGNGVDLIAYTMETNYVPPTLDIGLMRVVKGSLQSDEARGVVFFNVFKGQPVHGERQIRIHGRLTLETAPNMQTTDMDFVSENRLQWRVLE